MTRLTPIAEQWTQVEHLLDEALALPEAARDAWLAGLSGESATLRETLRALLRTQARIETDDFLRTLPRFEPPAAPTTEPQEGEHVGPYRLLRELGRGGMGLVWLAERHDGLAARPVALKLPRQAWGQALAERLAREREILATLEHPHIARLYDAGVDALGRPFIAMQYVEGEPIDRYCERLALPTAARIELLLQALSAVAHAHARLVVHRDIKPAHVLVNEAGQVTLLDFGVAKLLDGDRTADTALTEVAGRAFTPDYASPEQIRGEPLGTASDIYSLGVLAFELLAGARPYRLQRGTAAELEEAIMQTDAPRASDVAATPALRKALRGDLDAILGKALKKSPQERYASVDALAQDLQRHLRREPVLARPDSARYRLARFVGRHRLAVGMGTALGLTVLAGSSAALWQAREARTHERRANAELRRQHAVQELYIETLSRLTVLGAEEPEALSKPGGVSAVLMERLKDFEKRNADNPEALGAQLESVMIQLNYDARYAESLAVGQQLLKHQKAHDAPADDVLNTYASLGRTLQKLGRLDESEAMRREGLRWAPKVRDPESDSIRLTLAADLGDLLINKGQRAEALQVLTEADRIARETFAEDHLRYDTLISLAHFYLGFDDAKGLELMRQSEAEIAHLSNLDADYRANFAWWMSDALAANGDLAAAEVQATRAVELYRQTTGRDGRMAQRALSRLASVVAHREPARAAALLAQERQWFAARPDGIKGSTERLLRARELEAAALAGDVAGIESLAQVDTAPLLKTPIPLDGEALLTQLSRALVLVGRGEQALPLAEAVFAKQAGRSGGVTLAKASAELTLAHAQLAAARPADALRTAQALLLHLDEAQGQSHRSYREALALGALAAAQLKDAATAGMLLQRLERQPRPPFPSAVERADCDLLQAQALLQLGRQPEAAQIAEGVQRALATSGLQHAQSPRLLQARTLAGA